MAGLGFQELLIILVVVLVIFGAGRLPDVMKELGAGVRELKNVETEAKQAARDMNRDQY